MLLHSLRARIALVFVILMLVAQAAAFLVINSVILKNAHRNAEEQLSVAERVFGQVLHGNGDQLTQAASVVAADFGFREAVATHDSKTVASALQNHGDRIHADLVMLVDLDGKLIADSANMGHEGMAFPFPALIKTVAKKGDASSFGMIGGRAYQLVAVPVKAPVAIAWVVMGFAIDDMLAREMSSLTSLDVSFLTVEANGKWAVLASSLPGAARGALRNQTQLAEDGYATRIVRLHSEGQTVAVLLERSLTEALAPFRSLQSTLLLITLLGVLVSIVGSVLTARSVTRPIAALTQFSKRIGRGDYAEPIDVHQSDEIGELARAFNQMREGDKSFVLGMSQHKDDEIIVRSTIDLGHNMGLKVVAEGVETEGMLERLKALRCDLAQGYHLSRPLPPARLEAWLDVWQSTHEGALIAGAEEA